MNLRGGGSRRGGTSRNNNDNRRTIPGEVELEQLFQLADYEINHDPYRGMLAATSSLSSSKPIPMIIDNIEEEELEGQQETSKSSSRRRQQNSLLQQNEQQQQQQPQNSTATTTALTNNNDNNEMIQSTTSKRNNTVITTPWTRCQWGAIQLSTEDYQEDSNQSTTTTTTTTTNNNNNNKNKNNPSPELMVRHIVQCSCPSLIAWTRTKQQGNNKSSGGTKGSKKRSRSNNNKDNNNMDSSSSTTTATTTLSLEQQQHRQLVEDSYMIGARSNDNNYQCICDYNPLCLGSMGGIINDILSEELQHVRQNAIQVLTLKEKESSTSVIGTTPIKNLQSQSQSDENLQNKENENVNSITMTKTTELTDSQPSMDTTEETISSANNSNSNNNENTTTKKEGTNDGGVFAFLDEDTKTKSVAPPPSTSSTNDDKKDLLYESPPPPLKKRKRENSSTKSSSTPSSLRYVSDVFRPEHLGSFRSNNPITYSKRPQQLLDGIRKSLDVGSGPIRSYVYRTLRASHTTNTVEAASRKRLIEAKSSCDGDQQRQQQQQQQQQQLTLDEYMKRLQKWHETIRFKNPMEDSILLSGDRFIISFPPGISNLGATCYLNTQLQCLAQNTAFLKGIFSWREVNSNHNMNLVMSTLQLLLAKMVLGGECTVTTEDFSNALGLKLYEQQDPNEFARLLFERMDEAFQECCTTTTPTTTTTNKDNNKSNDKKSNIKTDEDLSNLMQRIFHGVTTYETTCLTCKSTSERSEGFMDLNLPIVKRGNKNNNNDSTNTATTTTDDPSSSSSQNNNKANFFGNSKNIDTDVQHCLDQYTYPEVLDGDNQYFCSSCDCKRDAKRVLKFTELPPVLNVQLSRYVFDRAKFIKKKVTDKVLIPKVLYAQRNIVIKSNNKKKKKDDGDDDNREAPAVVKKSRKRYLLCAVMRHQGTSAYRGHYVAEAMDWMTGQWFEFNDETVKILYDGPSCSYDPEENTIINNDNNNNGDQKSQQKNILNNNRSGSQDAYNMYYVEESYLAKNAMSCLLQRERLCDFPIVPNNSAHIRGRQEETRCDVLARVSAQRDSNYSDLSEMVLADIEKNHRLKRRREGIRNFMFPNASSLDIGVTSAYGVDCTTNSKKKNGTRDFEATSPVWVDAVPLRKYLGCEDDLDDHLRSSEPLLKHKHLLCEHGRLHPRVSRRGKLLPARIYNAYTSLLMTERTAILKEGNSKPIDKTIKRDEEEINDCVITPDKNLFCATCSTSYRKELSEKLEFIKTLKFLYDNLDPKNCKSDEAAYSLNDDEKPSCVEDGFAYAMSRQYITKVRKQIAAMMKTVSNLDDGKVVTSSSSGAGDATLGAQSTNVISEGLDCIDISTFQFQKNEKDQNKLETSQSNTGDKKISGANNESVELEEEVNFNITCPHGNCDFMNNKRIVRYVSWDVWFKLKKLFPKAIEHKRKRIAVGNDDSQIDGCCSICREEKASKEMMRSCLENWAKTTKESSSLKSLIGRTGGTSRDRETDVQEFTNSKTECRLVHRSDIQTWRKAVTTLSNLGKLDAADSFSEMKGRIENLVFPNFHSVVLEFERQPVERLLASLRSLTCGEHRLAISSAVFKDNISDPLSRRLPVENGPPTQKHLSSNIAVLSGAEYSNYIESLYELLSILNEPYEGASQVKGSVSSPVVIDDEKHNPKIFDEIRRVTDTYHPAIRVITAELLKGSLNEANALFFLEGSSNMFGLFPAVCKCETCKKEFAPLQIMDDFGDRELGGGKKTGDSAGTAESSRRENELYGSAAIDPIVVESDVECYSVKPTEPPDTFDLRVFQVMECESIEDAIASAQSIAGIAPEPDISGPHSVTPRRSRRKRKSRFPAGPLLREDSIKIGLHHNIAALRLLLLEKCDVSVSGHRLILVVSFDDGRPAESVEIRLDWGSKTFREIVVEAAAKASSGSEKRDTAVSGSTTSKIFLLHQTEIVAEKGSDSKVITENIMDSLLELSNLTTSSEGNGGSRGGKTKSNRPTETGFSGTLLHSSSAKPRNASPQDDEVKDPPPCKKPRIAASEVSDEEKENSLGAREEQEPRPNEKHVVRSESFDDEIPPAAFPSPNKQGGNREENIIDSSTPSRSWTRNDSEVVNEPQVIRQSQVSQLRENRTSDSSGDENADIGVKTRREEWDIDESDKDVKVCSPQSLSEIESIGEVTDALAEEIVVGLLKILPASASGKECLKAALWATGMNPSITCASKLLDTAFAKYLENNGFDD